MERIHKNCSLATRAVKWNSNAVLHSLHREEGFGKDSRNHLFCAQKQGIWKEKLCSRKARKFIQLVSTPYIPFYDSTFHLSTTMQSNSLNQRQYQNFLNIIYQTSSTEQILPSWQTNYLLTEKTAIELIVVIFYGDN